MSPVAIIGQTRSGTSMTAQMVAAAGFSVAGSFPDFEHEKSPFPPDETGWWREFDAVKIVDPHTGRTLFNEELFPRRIVVVRRDVQAQAESFNKFMAWSGVRQSPVKQIRRSIKRIRPYYLRRARPSNVLGLYFEDMLADPEFAAEAIVRYLGGGDIEAAASAVLPRSPDCYPGMLEETLLRRAGVDDE